MQVNRVGIWRVLSVLLFCHFIFILPSAQASAAFVQATSKAAAASSKSLSLSFPANTLAGDVILVAFDHDTTSPPSSVTDSQGNVFISVGSPLTTPDARRSRVYYAKSIKGGPDTVTVTLSANSAWFDLSLTEYTGVDHSKPIDAQAGAAGHAGAVSSGNAKTSLTGDVLYAYCVGELTCTMGSGFAARSTAYNDVIADKLAGPPGIYAATGLANSGWSMQLVALKPASTGGGTTPAINSATTASGIVGTSFSYQMTATNAPTSYAATGLPAGLSVNTTTGLISGTPTASGTSTVALRATNSSGTGSATLTLTIALARPGITSATSATGILGTFFSYQIGATNAPISYGATGLPSALSVSPATGLISGTPASVGMWTVTLSATNSGGTGSDALTLTIGVARPVITSATTASGTLGAAFSYQITASNIPTSYGATGLPQGLSVNFATGQISGTPTSAGTWTVTLSATNSNGTGTAALTLTIGGALPVITSSTTTSGTAGTAFSYQISATNSPTSYGAAGLPVGLSVSTTTGLISGTPTAASASTVTLSAIDSAGTGSATLTLTITSGSVQPQLITLSSNGKYLINASTGQPVFLVAEQGFDLDQGLSDSDLETYLSDRASKGFNLIWMAVVDNSYSVNPPYDSQGNAPFSGGDFLNMQSAYFTHLDYVLNRMAAHGITALLGPAFSGSPCGPLPSGYCTSMEAASDATMTAYGQYLGTRYKTFPNIIWLIGGDMDSSSDLKSKHNDIATGIRSKDTVHLMTAENIREQSSLDVWSGYSWLGLNGLYNLPSDIPAAAESNFTRSDSLPEFMMEDWCENEHSETPLGLRTEGYWAVLSGAYLGRQFCNFPMYSFKAGWQAQLNSVGSVSQSSLGKLFRSREHWLLVPDSSHSVVTAGYGSGATLTTTARTSDGQSVIVYIPNGNAATITVNLSKITSSTGTVQGWWYDPQTGSTQNLGAFSNSGTRTFRAPDTNDWVLVLDDASANLPAPGTSTLIAH